MILASNGIIASQIATTDADALAFFNRVTTAGGSLSTTEKTAVNQLVLDLKSYSIWNSMKAIYPMVGASAAACAQNLVSSSFTGTFSGGVTYASTGVTGNGTNGYMDTGLNANTILNINSSFISVYKNSTDTNSLGLLMGINDLSLFLHPTSSTFNGSLANTNYVSQSGNYSTTGFYAVNRPSSSVQKIIRNNTIIKSDNTSSVSYASSQNAYLLNYNTNSTFASGARIAFAHIGDGLTDSEASNFYTAVQSFQTTLNRQV